MSAVERPTQRANASRAWALAATAFLGLIAILTLPALAPHVPHFGSDEEARYALTSIGVLALCCGYVYWRSSSLAPSDNWWLVLVVLFVTALVAVKLVMSPVAFASKREDVGLTRFVATGLVVISIYILGIWLSYRFVQNHPEKVSLSKKLAFSIEIGVLAVVVRLLAAFVQGTASSYVHDFFRGPGLLLPAIVVVAVLAVVTSFEHAGSNMKGALLLVTELVVLIHVLWVVYMYRLFG